MYFKFKRSTLLILGLTSVVLSRAIFFLIDDPEGPNLLIVMVLAAFIFLLLLLVRTVLTKHRMGRHRLIGVILVILGFLWLYVELAVGLFTNWGS